MLKYLVDEGLYESKEDTMRREEVLGRIDQVTHCVSFFVSSILHRKVFFFLYACPNCDFPSTIVQRLLNKNYTYNGRLGFAILVISYSCVATIELSSWFNLKYTWSGICSCVLGFNLMFKFSSYAVHCAFCLK